MPEKRKKQPHDFSIIARRIVEEATREDDDTESKDQESKKPDYAALGREGGKKGGKARAQKLTPEERKEIARKAAKARWGKQEQE